MAHDSVFRTEKEPPYHLTQLHPPQWWHARRNRQAEQAHRCPSNSPSSACRECCPLYSLTLDKRPYTLPRVAWLASIWWSQQRSPFPILPVIWQIQRLPAVVSKFDCRCSRPAQALISEPHTLLRNRSVGSGKVCFISFRPSVTCFLIISV